MKTLKGICACPGEASGIVRHFSPGAEYTTADIVVMKDWLAQNVIAATGAGALISATGGLTCHASIVARELNIPALISVNISDLQEGMRIIVDAADERMEIQ